MKKLLLFLLLSLPAFSLDQFSGWCEQGNYTVSTQGMNSSTKVQKSFPQCTVTVYTHGSSTPLPIIYQDNNATPTVLTNPFTANADGSWQFFAPNGRYDVTISSGGLPAPFTLYNVLLCDPQDGTGLFSCGPGTAPTQPVDVSFLWNNSPTASLVLVRKVFVFATNIPADCAHSHFIAETAATASTTFTLFKCTAVGSCSSFGTAVFGAAGTSATFSCTSTSFAEGEILKVISPLSPDATLADLGGAIYGTRSGEGYQP